MKILTEKERQEQNLIEENQSSLARRVAKRRAKVNLCEDCGEPTENQDYCDMCNLRHLQFSDIVCR